MSARDSTIRGNSAALAHHPQPGTAARDVRDNRGATVDLGHLSKADREGEFDALSALQSKVAGLHEHATRAQVARATQSPMLAW